MGNLYRRLRRTLHAAARSMKAERRKCMPRRVTFVNPSIDGDVVRLAWRGRVGYVPARGRA